MKVRKPELHPIEGMALAFAAAYLFVMTLYGILLVPLWWGTRTTASGVVRWFLTFVAALVGALVGWLIGGTGGRSGSYGFPVFGASLTVVIFLLTAFRRRPLDTP